MRPASALAKRSNRGARVAIIVSNTRPQIFGTQYKDIPAKRAMQPEPRIKNWVMIFGGQYEALVRQYT